MKNILSLFLLVLFAYSYGNAQQTAIVDNKSICDYDIDFAHEADCDAGGNLRTIIGQHLTYITLDGYGASYVGEIYISDAGGNSELIKISGGCGSSTSPYTLNNSLQCFGGTTYKVYWQMCGSDFCVTIDI